MIGPTNAALMEAIVLAGGRSQRFGGAKLLAPYRGGLVIEGALRTALRAPVARTILVTGHDRASVQEAALALAQREFADRPLHIAHAAAHAEGMAASLREGIAALLPDTQAAFIFLGDMPAIPVEVAHALAGGIEAGLAAAPAFGGRRGHPVLVKRDLFPALSALTGDTGARALLDGLGERLHLIPVSAPGVLFDVDYPMDLAS